MTSHLEETLYDVAEAEGYECTELQVKRFVARLIHDNKVSSAMANDMLYVSRMESVWVREFKYWLEKELTVKYQLLDGGDSQTFKIVCERLEEAQLVWDSLVYLRTKYRVVSGRPF